MKKAAALLGSVLVYTGMFLLFFSLFMGERILWFVLGFPLAAAVCFVAGGNLFFDCWGSAVGCFGSP